MTNSKSESSVKPRLDTTTKIFVNDFISRDRWHRAILSSSLSWPFKAAAGGLILSLTVKHGVIDDEQIPALAARSRVSPRTMQRCITALESIGAVVVNRTVKPHEYRFPVPSYKGFNDYDPPVTNFDGDTNAEIVTSVSPSLANMVTGQSKDCDSVVTTKGNGRNEEKINGDAVKAAPVVITTSLREHHLQRFLQHWPDRDGDDENAIASAYELALDAGYAPDEILKLLAKRKDDFHYCSTWLMELVANRQLLQNQLLDDDTPF